ncbi:MAG: thrombospondin type 3 repeat-containing protein [Pseudomonadota bacterium]
MDDQNRGTAQTNACPTADAGYSLPINLGVPATLNASRSSDIDGDALSFQWTMLKRPSGSLAAVADASALITSFTPDLAGDYVLRLESFDERGGYASDDIRFSTKNSLPVAIANSFTTAQLDQMMRFDASFSFDADSDNLSYRWSLLESPQGSELALRGTDSPYLSLTPDARGAYALELTVSDQYGSSDPLRIEFDTENAAPIANIKNTRRVAPFSKIMLDAGRSLDKNNDTLRYHWAVLYSPPGQNASIIDSDITQSELSLGAEGDYLVQLVVDDGVALSAPATMHIEVTRNVLTDIDVREFVARAGIAGGDDADGDGVVDELDNCVNVANAPQRDTDGDGIGNFCDPDLNNDGIVNFIDISTWTGFFLSNDPDSDFNGDGVVNFIDFVIITQAFLEPPGPPGTIVWVSLVDGNFNDRLNWQPQVVPTAGTTAIIDPGVAVTASQSGGDITVKNLVVNETLTTSSTAITATSAIELGGVMNMASGSLNSTAIVPSLAGVGQLNVTGAPTWTASTIGVDATIMNSSNINVTDGLTVNGMITIDAPASPTGLVFTNNQSVGGTGSIVFNGVVNGVITEPRLFPLNGTIVTFDSSLTIRGGKGTIGQSNASVILNGPVIADIASQSIQVNGNPWSGSSTLSAINGGGLILAGNFDNGAGTINLDTANGTLGLASSAALRNATIVGSLGTNMATLGGISTFENLSYTGDVSLSNAHNINVIGDLNFNGTATITAPASPTGFIFNTDSTVSGNATFVFDSVINGVITEPRLFPANSTVLTLNDTVTVRGSKGTIGQSSAGLILLGDVIAEVDSESIRIIGSTLEMWSGGPDTELTATNGGGIELQGTLDNAGQTVEIDTSDGSFTLLGNARLRNAVFNGTAGTLMVMQNATLLDNMQFNHDLQHFNASNTTVENGLTLNGTATIVSTASPTGYIFSGSQTVSGNATFVFDSEVNTVITEPRLFPSNNTVLTLDDMVTVRGTKGTIGQLSAGVVLLGDVIADQTDESIRIIGSTLQTWSGGADTELTATNGGGIELQGTLDNAGQTVEIDAANGSFTLLSSGRLRNAVFNGTAGTLMVAQNSTIFDNMQFNHDLQQFNSTSTSVENGLTLNGTATITSTASPTGYTFSGSQSVSGNATFVFDSAGNTVITEPRLLPSNSSVLTIENTVTVRGTKGTIGQGNAFVNMNGTVSADSGQNIRITGFSWTGTGTLESSNGGGIEMQGIFDNADQTLNVDTAGNGWTLLANASIRNATIVATAGSEMELLGNTSFQNANVTADLRLNNAVITTVTDGLTFNGTATIVAPNSPTGFQLNGTQTVDGNATFVYDGTGNTVISEPRFNIGNGSLLTLGSNVVITGNQYSVGQNGSGRIISNGSIFADGGTAQINAVSGFDIPFVNNGTVGAINGGRIELPTATNNSFDSPGTMRIGPGAVIDTNGQEFIYEASGNVEIEIDSTGPGVLVTGADDNSFNGTLTVSAVNGFAPAVGNSFIIITQTDIAANTFGTVVSNGLGAGESFDISYNMSSVTATVTN